MDELGKVGGKYFKVKRSDFPMKKEVQVTVVRKVFKPNKRKVLALNELVS